MKLFCRKYGTGPPLIILHGLFGSSDNWISIAKKLDDSFSVFLPDLRNHGLSPHSNIHDYDAMSLDLLELTKDLKLDHLILAGHSMGGKVAIRFAMKWPEMLDGLLIADISPFTPGKSLKKDMTYYSEILNTMLSSDLSSLRTRKEAELLFSSIKSEQIKGLILKNLKRNAENNFSWKINTLSLLRNLHRIMEPVKPEENGEKQISGFPVYFLKAQNSDYLTEDDFGPILKLFPTARFITIPGSGHWVHSDNPEAVCSAFLKFFNSD